MGKPFLFRCPVTGLMVQGYLQNDDRETASQPVYESVECIACGGYHLIDASTGELVFGRDGG